jgi:hypothetical protein
MASVVMPYAALTGDLEAVRELADVVLGTTDREWSQLSTTAIPRALARAGEIELLERTAAALREKSEDVDAPRIAIGAMVAEGLLALAEGRADEAAEKLQTAADHERRLGWTYRAACIDVDLAAALAAGGRAAEAQATDERAKAVLEPLGCVNPF